MQVVNEQYGNDEYMHMKSKDDEIEYRESNMPPRAAEGPPHDAGVESTPRRDALDESMDSNVHNVGDEKMGHTPPARRRGEEENMSADEYERYRRAGHTPRGSHSVADMNDDDHSLNYPHDMYDITDLSDHEGADAHDRVEDVLPPLTASDMEGATDESYVHNFPSLNVDVDPSGTGGEHAYAPPSSHGLPSGGGLKRDKSSRATKKSSGVRFPDDPETAAEYGGGEGPPTAPTRTARFADDVPDAPAPHAKHKSRASYAHSTDANEDARKSKLSKLFDEDDDEVLDNRENAQQHRPTNENQTPLDVEPESDPLLRTSSSMFDID